MTAGDFTLIDQEGQPWTLSEHRGAAVVLIFLRGDWWPYCDGQLVSLAARHDEIVGAGALVVGITVDRPQRNSALIAKLDLPFPILSDPHRSLAIAPYGVADEVDERNIARPATIIIDPGGDEIFRFVSRDFADRLTEDSIVAALQELGLPPVSQDPPRLGPAEAGPRAVPFDQLARYFRGARFAVVALSRRYPEIGDDAAAYIAELDRYADNISELFRRKRAREDDP